MEDLIVDSEILHGGEGGDVERWLEPQNKSFFCDCYIVSIYLFIIHLFLSIKTYLKKIAIEHLNSYLEEPQGEVQSLSRGIRLQVLFWVIGYVIYIILSWILFD